MFEVRYVRQHDGVFVKSQCRLLQKGGNGRPFSLSVSAVPKLVYLDSSDFSNLSAPVERLSEEYRALLNILRAHKESGAAEFFMSAVHISEAVHAAETHKPNAVRRAELMRELCGSNILRFPTDLPTLELQKALRCEKNARLSLEEVTSNKDEWFGVQVDLDGLARTRTDANQQVKDILRARMPRREWRKLLSELDFRKRSAHMKWRELLTNAGPAITLEYPLSLFDRDTVLAWLLGEISDADIREKTIKIAHDPYIMFKHLLDEINHRQVLYDILRKQGLEMAQKIEASANDIIPQLCAIVKSGIEFDVGSEIGKLCSRPSFLRRTVQSFTNDSKLGQIADDQLPQIIESCPSLFAFTELNKELFISRAYSYLARIRAGDKSVKQASPSDFGDIMHCYYAPYFDVFRCDVRFGAILKKHRPVRARIADRLADVARMLADTLAADRQNVA